MQVGTVVGTVVATQKHPKLHGAKLLLVQPMSLEGTPRGTALLAIDAVGAGVGEQVLVVIEGKAAGDALGRKAAAVDAAMRDGSVLRLTDSRGRAVFVLGAAIGWVQIGDAEKGRFGFTG